MFVMNRVKLLTLSLFVLLAQGTVQAEAPATSDPQAMAGGGLPGTFPGTTTAANIRFDYNVGTVFDGAGRDNIAVTFPAAGPTKWTSSRYNAGDIALSIGPGNPSDPSYYPSTSPTDFNDSYSPLEAGQPFENTTLAWRIAGVSGASLATVRHNGVDQGLTFGTDIGGNPVPVGTTHGIAYFNIEASQGWGFRMDDGEFRNGFAGGALGQSTRDLQIGVAGDDAGIGEGTSNVATAFFPYEQGWVGAWANPGNTGGYNGSSSGLPPSALVYDAPGTTATVTLPGVDSASDGMLYVAPTSSNNVTNIAAATPNGASGWTVSVREDNDANLAGTTLVPNDDNGFQFLYVPYSAPGLIGGHVDGSDASLVNSAGTTSFSVSRNSAGQYALSVLDAPGSLTKLDENDGSLILSVAGSAGALADRAFLSYAYDSGSGDFIVEARELTAATGGTENQFGNVLSLSDTDFYFTWVDFTNPLTPTIPGDFNDDGDVDGSDFLQWQRGESPDPLSASDLADWQANYGATTPLLAAAATVPEPTSGILFSLALTSVLFRRKVLGK